MKTFEAKKQWIDSEGESNLIEITVNRFDKGKKFYIKCKIDYDTIHDEDDSFSLLISILHLFGNRIEYDNDLDIIVNYISIDKLNGKFKPSNTFYKKRCYYKNVIEQDIYFFSIKPRINNYKKDGKRYQDIYCGLDELINCDWFEQFVPQHRKEVFNNFKVLLKQVLDDIRKEYKLPREI